MGEPTLRALPRLRAPPCESDRVPLHPVRALGVQRVYIEFANALLREAEWRSVGRVAGPARTSC